MPLWKATSCSFAAALGWVTTHERTSSLGAWSKDSGRTAAGTAMSGPRRITHHFTRVWRHFVVFSNMAAIGRQQTELRISSSATGSSGRSGRARSPTRNGSSSTGRHTDTTTSSKACALSPRQADSPIQGRATRSIGSRRSDTRTGPGAPAAVGIGCSAAPRRSRSSTGATPQIF